MLDSPDHYSISIYSANFTRIANQMEHVLCETNNNIQVDYSKMI
jgi:hypothetical protein